MVRHYFMFPLYGYQYQTKTCVSLQVSDTYNENVSEYLVNGYFMGASLVLLMSIYINWNARFDSGNFECYVAMISKY